MDCYCEQIYQWQGNNAFHSNPTISKKDPTYGGLCKVHITVYGASLHKLVELLDWRLKWKAYCFLSVAERKKVPEFKVSKVV